MRKLTALLTGIALATAALPAWAGVVIKQKQNVSNGTNTKDSEQTIMVQGNKQKMVIDKHTVIYDLDKGKMYVLDPAEKSYFEMDFPPKGQMAAMMAQSAPSSMNFKKTDAKPREIAGHKCQDYSGGGHMMTGEYTVTECFSKDAPGAAEYGAFEKNMTSKLKDAGSPGRGEMPEGVPLAMDSSMKMGNISIPGMSAEQAAKINQMVANRPPIVTKMTVTKVETQKLSDDTFAIPADFKKKDLPSGPGMMGAARPHPPAAGAPAPAPATH